MYFKLKLFFGYLITKSKVRLNYLTLASNFKKFILQQVYLHKMSTIQG